jgi:hypothetical protein
MTWGQFVANYGGNQHSNVNLLYKLVRSGQKTMQLLFKEMLLDICFHAARLRFHIYNYY